MFALEDLFDVKDIDQDGKKFDNGKEETEGNNRITVESQY
jgi:hypothetical protein